MHPTLSQKAISSQLLFLNIGLLPCILLLVRDAYLPAGGLLDASGMIVGRDFVNFWAGGHILRSGDLAPLFDLHAYNAIIMELFGQKAGDYIWSYPPHAGLLIAPLSFLPYLAALALFEALTLGLLLFTLLPFIPREHRPLCALLLVTSPVVLPVLYMGQNGFLAGACIIGSLLWQGRKPRLAGLYLAVLTFKPQLGIAVLVALIAMKAWRTIAYAFLFSAVMLVASLMLHGWPIWEYYIFESLPYHAHLFKEYANEYFMISPFGALRQARADADTALDLHMLLAGVAGICLFRIVREPAPLEAKALLASLATFLMTPYAQGHDMVAVHASLLLCLFSGFHICPPLSVPAIRMGLWILPFLSIPHILRGSGIGPAILLLSFAMLAYAMKRQRPLPE